MKTLYFFLILLTIWSCQSATSNEPSATPEAAFTSSTPAAPAIQIQNDSLPQVNLVQRTVGRAVNEIEKEFPFDIKLRSADGKIKTSDQIFAQNKQPTVLLFWLTTCIPCRYELTAINQKFANWQQSADFNFYAISTDFERNWPSFIKRVETSNWPFPAYHDMNREFRRVMPGGLNGLPQVFVLDPNGEVKYHKRKYRTGDEDILFEEIKKLANS